MNQTSTEMGSLEETIQGILTLIRNTDLVTDMFMNTFYSDLSELFLACVYIMNLSIALFLAQLLFQVSHLLTPWPHVCSIAASVQHSLWFSVFLWMISTLDMEVMLTVGCLAMMACSICLQSHWQS